MISIAFFIFGFITVISQTIMLRQLLVVFGGNELSIGIILAGWLLGSTLGSYGASIFRKFTNVSFKNIIVFLLFIAGLYLLIFFPALSNVRSFLNLLPGQAVGFSGILLASFCVIIPLSFLMGCLFSFGAKWAEEEYFSSFSWKIYFWESAGFMAGGALFVFLLLKVFNAIPLTLLTAALCIIFSLILFLKKLPAKIAVAVISAVFFWIIIPNLTSAITNYTNAKLYPGYGVQELKDTPYSQLAELERENQKYLLSDGAVLGTFPSEETEFSESFSYIPLLYRPDAKRVLLFGGAGKYVLSLLKNPKIKLDYVEIDPYIMRAVRRLMSEKAAKSERVSFLFDDGRKLVSKISAGYDIVYLGFPYPSTITLNRFFTKEFFRGIKRILSPAGILVFELPGSESYIGDELAAVDEVLIQTANGVFGNIRIFPGEKTLILACERPFVSKTKDIVKRFKNLPFETKFMSEAYVSYRADPAKEKRFGIEIAKYEARNSIRRSSRVSENTDLVPVAVKNSLIYVFSIAEAGSAKFISALYRHIWILWIALLVWFLSRKMNVLGTSFASGAAGMGLQIISIIALQIHAGNIYSLVGLANAVFMAGLALGAVFFWRFHESLRVKYIEMFFVAWIALWLLLFYLKFVSTVFVFVFSAGSGFIVGLEFPALVGYRKNSQKDSESVSAGKVYALDLLGGCFGAVIVGTFMIPTLGLFETLLFLIVLKMTSASWWIRTERSG